MGLGFPQAVRRFTACLAATVALASCHASNGAAGAGEPQLTLPASFTGTLPCGLANGPRTLRALGIDGRPAGQGNAYDLVSDGRLEPSGLQRPLHGMFRYLADAPIFEECLTGRRHPVAMEADYLALERAMSHASLSPQYWRVATLRGAAALREQQDALPGLLEDARTWRIQGEVLELFGAAGQPLAVLEAVYLR